MTESLVRMAIHRRVSRSSRAVAPGVRGGTACVRETSSIETAKRAYHVQSRKAMGLAGNSATLKRGASSEVARRT